MQYLLTLATVETLSDNEVANRNASPIFPVRFFDKDMSEVSVAPDVFLNNELRAIAPTLSEVPAFITVKLPASAFVQKDKTFAKLPSGTTVFYALAYVELAG